MESNDMKSSCLENDVKELQKLVKQKRQMENEYDNTLKLLKTHFQTLTLRWEAHDSIEYIFEKKWKMENDLDETLKQNEFLKDRLLEASLAGDVKNLVITSCVEIRNKDLHDEIERISKESKGVSNESKTADTAKSIAFEVALQHKPQENNSLKTLQKENENFMASLQIENAHLKQTYKDLLSRFKETAKFEAYFEKTKVVLERQLARKVDDSKAEKDRFLKEINHLRTQLENLKGKRVETKFDNSSILGKPPLLNNERDQL
ncbi:hypothetical protein Tco_0816940 [Tanacetum coccineum]